MQLPLNSDVKPAFTLLHEQRTALRAQTARNDMSLPRRLAMEHSPPPLLQLEFALRRQPFLTFQCLTCSYIDVTNTLRDFPLIGWNSLGANPTFSFPDLRDPVRKSGTEELAVCFGSYEWRQCLSASRGDLPSAARLPGLSIRGWSGLRHESPLEVSVAGRQRHQDLPRHV